MNLRLSYLSPVGRLIDPSTLCVAVAAGTMDGSDRFELWLWLRGY